MLAATAPAIPSNIIIKPAKYIAASPKYLESLYRDLSSFREQNIICKNYNFLRPIKNDNLIRLGDNIDGGYIVDSEIIKKINTCKYKLSSALLTVRVKEGLIDFKDNFELKFNYSSKTLQSDGENWWIINKVSS